MNRSFDEICVDLLRAASVIDNPSRIAGISTVSHLNFRKRYLPHLIDKKYLEINVDENKESYDVTDEGMEFMKQHDASGLVEGKDYVAVDPNKRRDKIDGRIDLLKMAIGGDYKARLVHRIGSNVTRFSVYLPPLLRNGFLEETIRGKNRKNYWTTPEGVGVLRVDEEIQKALGGNVKEISFENVPDDFIEKFKSRDRNIFVPTDERRPKTQILRDVLWIIRNPILPSMIYRYANSAYYSTRGYLNETGDFWGKTDDGKIVLNDCGFEFLDVLDPYVNALS